MDTISFNTTDVGVTKSVASWGVDTAWPNYDNVRQSIQNIGVNNVDTFRVTVEFGQSLIDNGNGTYSLNATAQSNMDNQLSLAALGGAKPLTFVAGSLPTTFNATNWVRAIKATQEYINSKPGFTTTQIKSIEAFNEPDFWAGEGTAADLNNVIQQLKTYSVFQNTSFAAGSTLNSNNAQFWLSNAPQATAGSSHLLGGSLTSWANFIDYTLGTGRPFTNPELHSLGEAIVGAQHGMSAGTFWGEDTRSRGLFVQASDGQRLGYYEDLPRQSAAAVYRAPNGNLYAFAGGLERFGSATAYRFVVNDRDVYFNGIPVREFMLHTDYDKNASSTDNDFQNYGSWSSQGSYADIKTTSKGVPALDGQRFKIVNSLTGQVMEVAGGGTADGTLIRSATDANAANQMWNIVRTRNGLVELFNANSGRTAEDAFGSLSNGASVWQYGTADNEFQQWYVEDAGNGSYYIRNAYSNKYLTSNSTNATLNDLSGSKLQQWQFVAANPTAGPKAQYLLQGNVNDSTGTYNATAFGSPTYGPGPTGGANQAIQLNGASSYVQLPSAVANSGNISISSYVKWNGGGDWQRIFDFGTGTTSYMFLSPRTGDGTMRFAITNSGSGGEQILDTSALPIGQWVQLTLTLGGNTGILYINGKPQVAGQILLDPSSLASTLNYLGKSQYADPLLNGSLADFRIYDYALSNLQVMDLVTRSLTWVGGQNGNTWDVGSTSNFKLASNAATSFLYADTVTFDGTGTSTINISGSVTPRSVTFSGSTNQTLTGTGAITGPGVLTKSGTSTLILANTGPNDFTGGVTISGGTLQVGNGGTTGSAGLGNIVNNSSLIFSRSNIISQGNDFGTISGSGSVAVTTGTLVLNSVNTYTGATTISPGATLQIGDGTSDASIANSASVSNQGNVLFNLTGTDTLTYANPISGAGSLTMSGSGTQILAGLNSYSGGTTINTGTLLAGTNSAFGSGTVTMNGGVLGTSAAVTIPNALAIAGAATIGYAGQTSNITLTGPLTGSGTLTNALTLSASSNVYFNGNMSGFTGTLNYTCDAGAATQWWRFGSNGSTVDLSHAAVVINLGNVTNTNAFSKNFGFTDGITGSTLKLGALSGNGVFQASYNNSGPNTLEVGALNTSTTFSGIVAGGGAGTNMSLVKVGSGTLTLSGSNLYTGATTISGGILSVSANANLGATTAGLVFNSGTLRPSAALTTSRAVTVNASGGTINTNGFTTTLNGSLSSSGQLTKSGAGALVISGSQSYTAGASFTASTGTTTFASDAGVSNRNLTINDNAAMTFTSSQHLAALNVGPSATATLTAGGNKVLVTNALSIDATATFDLTDNDLIVQATSGTRASVLAAVSGKIGASFHNGAWNSPGLLSSTAAGNSQHLAALGVILNDNGLGQPRYSTFDGQAVDINSILVKYTYYGDANLDGIVNSSDYALIDNGHNFGLSGWINGDFNFDGVVNGTDYALIDNAFNFQGGPLFSGEILGGLSGATSVPEPNTLVLASIALFAALACHKRFAQ